MRFFPLDKLINLHDGYSRQFKIDSLHLLLVQRAGERFVIEAHCPHRGHPLESAIIDDGIVQCALHAYRFSLHDGQLLSYGEEPCRHLRIWPVTYAGNEIGVVLGDGPGE